MRRWIYLLPISLFFVSYSAVILGGWLSWVLPVGIFVVLPIAEQWLPGTRDNLSADQEASVLADPFYDAALYSTVWLHLGLVASYLYVLYAGAFTSWELAGITATVGTSAGGFGINVAHELGHRRDTTARRAAKALLLATNYGHFYVEHNRGHHRRVATPDDPASAARGDTVYAFWWRSVIGGWRGAWQLENTRMAREDRPWYSWKSEMVQLQSIQLLLLAAVSLLGLQALVGWLTISLLGILMLETVNYLEHYGLAREKTARGHYERVQPHHSWNSNRPLGRAILFDLTRHSDHHANATRPYPVLRHFEEAPELPFGYPGGMVVSLIPPLFHRIMDRTLDAWEAKQLPRAA